MVQVKPLVWSKGEARSSGFLLKTDMLRIGKSEGEKKDSPRIFSEVLRVSAGFEKEKGLEFRKRDKFNGFKSRVGS